MQPETQSKTQYRKMKKREKAEKLAKAGLGGRRNNTLDKLRYATLEMRLHILKRDDYKCRYCSESVTIESANIDHVVPWKKGGRTHPTNLVAVCSDCNRKKLNRMDVRPRLKENRTKGVNPVRVRKHGPSVADIPEELKPAIGIECGHRMSPNCKRQSCLRDRL